MSTVISVENLGKKYTLHHQQRESYTVLRDVLTHSGSIVKRPGNLQQAILIDDYAEGKDTGIIDLVLTGDIDTTNLLDLTTNTERYIERKIRTLTITVEEYAKNAAILNKRP